jgi:hypothetical protein
VLTTLNKTIYLNKFQYLLTKEELSFCIKCQLQRLYSLIRNFWVIVNIELVGDFVVAYFKVLSYYFRGASLVMLLKCWEFRSLQLLLTQIFIYIYVFCITLFVHRINPFKEAMMYHFTLPLAKPIWIMKFRITERKRVNLIDIMRNNVTQLL